MQKFRSGALARRDFLVRGSRGFAAFLASARVPSAFSAELAQPASLFAELPGALLPPDENGLRLPPGFRSRIVARSGKPVVPGSAYLWHGAPDGGACYATPDGGWVYVSNAEIKVDAGGGGVGAMRFDAQGNIVDAYSLLSGSDNNCAGGKTPWQTWLSCEEVERGLVYECDPFGTRRSQALPALGRFKHEAVAVDPVNAHLYLTEDEDDGLLYRFIPALMLPDLSAGILQVAQVVSDDGNTAIVWHTVPDPSASQTPTRHQVRLATPFNGGEGIAWHEGLLYFTTKGDNRVWRYDTQTNRLGVLYDANAFAAPPLVGVDNVTLTASGDVLVAEDGGAMRIVLLTPNGSALPIMQVTGQDQSEICGPAFDPSFQRLYFSSQTGPLNLDTDGITYEISRSG
jgi:secreted PhoX family phosphatase